MVTVLNDFNKNIKMEIEFLYNNAPSIVWNGHISTLIVHPLISMLTIYKARRLVYNPGVKGAWTLGLALSLFGRSSLVNQIHYLTAPGLVKLKKELESFRTDKREEIARRIQLANQIGGTVDNAEYEEAKKEQSFIEGRIIDLQNILNRAEIIKDRKGPKSIVEVGATVTVYNKTRHKKEQYFIVGSHESEPSSGKISNVSPIGQALLQKKVGDIAKVQVPAGVINFEILKIR
tara:strand:- start:42 stop:740 length:699 start_codon:yes stop_codon:yes gene_type:complete